jgi:hypothetical protein
MFFFFPPALIRLRKGNVGELVPSGKAKSTVITRSLSTEDVVQLLGPYTSKIKVCNLQFIFFFFFF